MTPKEYEEAFCKGKRQAMEFFIDWLRDHIAVANIGTAGGLDAKTVLDNTLFFMGDIANKFEKKLEKDPKLIAKELPEPAES